MPDPIRFAATGPAGFLTAGESPCLRPSRSQGSRWGWTMVIANDPRRHNVGIWRFGTDTEWYDSYPCDKRVAVLEGEVAIENDPFSQTCRASDAPSANMNQRQHEGFGPMELNAGAGKRRRADVAYLRPAMARGNVRVITGGIAGQSRDKGPARHGCMLCSSGPVRPGGGCAWGDPVAGDLDAVRCGACGRTPSARAVGGAGPRQCWRKSDGS